ncbi:hypothetical protein GCM10009733_103320 [Nonomuraea maheshkhaliensis]|uniref:Uncharacterized protein n=1 Tax=Nonomuraea maheshkhaliensis TaxID=419590 RepID=A0ABN2HMS4_9ACTN
MADHRHTVEGLAAMYGHTWVISTDLVIGVAAYRRVNLPISAFGERLNVLVASDLVELAARLAEQEHIPIRGRVLPRKPLALAAAPNHTHRPVSARPERLWEGHTQG